MKTLHPLLSITGVVAMLMALSGCLESTDVTFHEPGVYRGPADPFIGNSDAAALEARFAGQRDR